MIRTISNTSSICNDRSMINSAASDHSTCNESCSIANVAASDIANVAASDIANVAASDIANVAASDIANVAASDIANVAASDIANEIINIVVRSNNTITCNC